MPGFLTDRVNNSVLDHFFGGKAMPPPPRALFVGLSLAKASKGGAVAEPLGGGYARVAVPNDPAHFPAATWGAKSNAGPIRFPAPEESWGRVWSIFLADSAVGGLVLAMADLPEPRMIEAGGRPVSIAADGLFLSHS